MAAPPPSASDGDRLTPEPALVARFRADLGRLAVACWSSPVIVAVSGGSDSLALLLLAAATIPHRVVAATVDHGLRPEAADEAAMVAEICGGLGVPHHVLGGDLPARVGGSANLSQRARSLRYSLLEALADRLGADAIATAHHADDQTETLLMRLNRAAGVGGLAGIRRENGRRVRPLLTWRRRELAALVTAAGLSAADDSTNGDDRFDRARLRKALADAEWLDRSAIARSADHLEDADRALEWATDRLVGDYASLTDGEARLSAFELPYELKRRLVLRCLRHVQPDIRVRGEALGRLLDTLENEEAMTLGEVACDIVWMALPNAGKLPLWRFRLAPPRRTL